MDYLSSYATLSVLIVGAAIVKSRGQEQCGDHIHIPENREFTYEELVKITNNFSVFIDEGGFGPVFHGQLKDGTQLAVKMRSPTSMSGKGMPEFLAEVLTFI